MRRGPATLAAVLAAALLASAGAQENAETYGCEPNPTGDPIGGGPGYRDAIEAGDYTVTAAEELLTALREASPGEVVFAPDGVEIDLSGERSIALREGVTLAGTRGLDGSEGALIHSETLGVNPLFVTAGNDVRLTGLRFRGPFAEREAIPELASLLVSQHDATEVDNCEIYDWNYSGVCGRLGASNLYVHHSFIHHCQYQGLGYGVSLDQCDAYVIANVFDWCRHHVACTGSPGGSYEAAYNLILENANGHYFDMHGGRDRGDSTDIAGDWIEIHHNTFRSEAQRAVVIRGAPSQGADVHHNWFAAPPADTVVSGGNTTVHENVYGPERTLAP